jgi:hypothetical protein
VAVSRGGFTSPFTEPDIAYLDELLVMGVLKGCCPQKGFVHKGE